MAVIEIQTMEGGRLEWVAVFMSTDADIALRWGNQLIHGFETAPRSMQGLKPSLRILDKEMHRGGKVIGSWQSEGYQEI